MATQFEQEMQQLEALVAQLGGAAEDQLADALEALQRRDAILAERVISGDQSLDELEAMIERRTALLFARRQLVAKDLRFAMSAVKVASALERVGDLAKNIARRSIGLTHSPVMPLVAPIGRLGRETLTLLSDSLDAFAQRDLSLANDVWCRDEQVDNFYNGLLREIMTEMGENPDRIAHLTQMMFIAKNLERIGDHSTFIAETVHQIETGNALSRARPKGEADGLL